MGQASSKQKTSEIQQSDRRQKQDKKETICTETVLTDSLQNIFDTILKYTNLNVDMNLTTTSLLFTTSKEKYLVKLISEGNDIPINVIVHSFDRFCTQEAHMVDERYGCSHGFILKKDDFLAHSIDQCKSFHKLNDDLRCYHGKLYYPVDIMWNPFGEWKPKGLTAEGDSAEYIYEYILQRWPIYRIFGGTSEMSLFTSLQERYLTKVISDGQNVPNEIICHVVNGCDNKAHLVSNDFGCCFGFILTRAEFESHVYELKEPVKKNQIGRVYGPDGKPKRNPVLENFPNCEIRHTINDRLECCFGVLSYSRKQFQEVCLNLRSRREEECQLIYSDDKRVQEVYRRIKWKRANDCDISKFYKWFNSMRSWEKYLIKLLEKRENLPIDIISHVLDGHDGCYIGAHMLDNDYGCCCGFILTEDEFLSHDFNACRSHHVLTNELCCENGKVYHKSAPWESPSSGCSHLGGNPVSAQRLKGIIPLENQPVARPPQAVAPPPPDHLDQ